MPIPVWLSHYTPQKAYWRVLTEKSGTFVFVRSLLYAGYTPHSHGIIFKLSHLFGFILNKLNFAKKCHTDPTPCGDTGAKP